MSRIAVVGAGYAGLCTALALATKGHTVTLGDIDVSKVNLISQGRAPISDPGVPRVLRSLAKRGRISASVETAQVAADSDIVFLVVGTPSMPDGSMDDSQLRAASTAIGEGLRRRPRQLVVVKSTVLPGTTESVIAPALESSSGLRAGEFGLCANPEFLREGRALQDSLHPTHAIIGERDQWSGRTLARLLAPFRCPIFRTSLRVAEAIKYATNAFLATKVTFANEFANLCTRFGLDADAVLTGMTQDPRIGPHHLRPGAGFGGSCLPKDLRAIVAAGRAVGYEPSLLSSVLSANDRQHMEVIRLLEEELGSLVGRRIALLGLAFKAGTDDVRESKALAISSELLSRGAHVIGYDPKAGENFARVQRGVEIAETARQALQAADACIVQAEWPEFSRLRSSDFAAMTTPVLVDARRTWPKSRVPKGLRYRRIG